MEHEDISKVEILPTGKLLVVLASGGKPMYQYIYREAAGIYWNNEQKAFKGSKPRKWDYSDWFAQIVTVASSELGVSLRLVDSTAWVNVPEQTRIKIYTVQNN